MLVVSTTMNVQLVPMLCYTTLAFLYPPHAFCVKKKLVTLHGNQSHLFRLLMYTDHQFSVEERGKLWRVKGLSHVNT